jgi:hypothetical protein
LSESGIDVAVGAFVVEDQNNCHVLPPGTPWSVSVIFALKSLNLPRNQRRHQIFSG